MLNAKLETIDDDVNIASDYLVKCAKFEAIHSPFYLDKFVLLLPFAVNVIIVKRLFAFLPKERIKLQLNQNIESICKNKELNCSDFIKSITLSFEI